jgi:hypothetical protein
MKSIGSASAVWQCHLKIVFVQISPAVEYRLN